MHYLLEHKYRSITSIYFNPRPLSLRETTMVAFYAIMAYPLCMEWGRVFSSTYVSDPEQAYLQATKTLMIEAALVIVFGWLLPDIVKVIGWVARGVSQAFYHTLAHAHFIPQVPGGERPELKP